MLATKSTSLRRYISKAVEEHNNIACQNLRDQWRQLILQPLSELDGNSLQSSLILVVDALDECNDDNCCDIRAQGPCIHVYGPFPLSRTIYIIIHHNNNDIRVIVQLLAEVRSLKSARLRILLTSRPDVPIRHGFSEIEHQRFVLHDIISPTTVDNDIKIFLEHEFKIIRQEHCLASDWPDEWPDDWPGEQVIRRLVQNACGLFIWAATACKYVRDGIRSYLRRKQKFRSK